MMWPRQTGNVAAGTTKEIPLVDAIIGILVITISLLILNAYALDLAGSRLGLLPALALLGAEAITILALIFSGRWQVPKISLDGIELAGFLLVIGVVLAYGLRLAGPSLFPVGNSVDAVHHYLLTDYIFTSEGLVHDPAGLRDYLGEMTVYPFGFSLLVAQLAKITGIETIKLLFPIAAFTVALSAGVIYSIICHLLPKTSLSKAAALGSASLLFIPYGYFIGSFADQNYYAMVLAELYLLVSLWYLVVPQRNWAWSFLLALSGATLVVIYPTWLPISFGSLVALTLLERGKAWRERVRWIAIPLVAALAVLAVFLPGRIQVGMSVLANEGSTIRPSVESVGWPLIILAVLGFVAGFLALRRFAPVYLFSTFLGLEILGLVVAQRLFEVGSSYAIFKMVYLVIYLLPIFVCLGVFWLIKSLERRISLGLVTSVVLLLVLAGSTWVLVDRFHDGSAVSHPITESEFQAGLWARDNLPPNKLDYVGHHPLSAYWLHIGVMNNKRSSSATLRWLLERPLTFDGWFYNPREPEYLVVGEMGGVPADPGYDVLFRSDPSAVLRRSPSYRDSLERQNALFTDFRTTSRNGRIMVDLKIFDVNAAKDPLSLAIGVRRESRTSVLGEYVLRPDREVRTQFVGVDFDPLDLSANGYINRTDRQFGGGSARMADGIYSIFLGLQKDGRVVVSRNVARFRLLGGRLLSVEPFDGEIVAAAPRTGNGPAPSRATPIVFDNKILLQGYDQPREAVKAGETLVLTLHWKAADGINAAYKTSLLVVGEQEQVLAQVDQEPLDWRYPTWRWRPGEELADTYALTIPKSAPSGRAQIKLLLYDAVTQRRAGLVRLPETAVEQIASLGEVEVERP